MNVLIFFIICITLYRFFFVIVWVFEIIFLSLFLFVYYFLVYYKLYLDVFCGGISINDLGGSQKIYVGGNKLKIKVDVEYFTFDKFQIAIKKVVGYRNVEKMHFRMPGTPLASGLKLLYELSIDDILKIIRAHLS